MNQQEVFGALGLAEHNSGVFAGEWLDASGEQIEVINPTTGEALATVAMASADDYDRVADSSVDVFQRWRNLPAPKRGEYVRRLGSALREKIEPLGALVTMEMGKILPEGIGEVRRAAQIFRYYGNEGDRQAGEIFASPRAGEQILVTRKPVGVVGVITPFNFPIAIPAWKLAPALVYGNTVVWKPASTVPLLAIRLAQALSDAGLPAGVLNLLIGGSAVGDAIVEHHDIDAITFTGSTGIGRRIAATAGCVRPP